MRKIIASPDLLVSCSIIAAAAVVALATVGVARGTYAAGGSDSSCYALMAEALASGRLQPESDLVSRVPWPDAPETFTPGGFVPSDTNPSASAPVCAPGFSLLLAPLVRLGGRDALFWMTPFAGALLVWMTFLAARELSPARGPLAGAMAAVLVSASPPVLYQVVQPMNDITTVALWMAVFVSLLRRRWALAGGCCGLALLVRPNLLPLAAVAAVYAGIGDWGLGTGSGRTLSPRRAIAVFAAAALPSVVLVVWLNRSLYGSPFRTGYGQLGSLFALSNVFTNAARYLRWLIETHTVLPLVALAAPFVVARENRRGVLLAFGLMAATSAIYFAYTPFDDWSYLRFQLPAIALMIVLASVVTAESFGRLAGRAAPLAVAVVTIALALFCVRAAGERQAFALQFLEQRYRSAGTVVRDRLPPRAVVLAVWDSGAVRFHGRREALAWDGLDPAWLDRALAWLAEQGRPPYIMVESWEEPRFRGRFGHLSEVGKLDWPPKYEIDRIVRIYDPQDRARYQGGERVDTEFLWPLRR